MEIQAVKAERVLASPSGRTPNGPNPIDLSLRLDLGSRKMNGKSHYLVFLQIGLRWRTEKEVISGKAQFICGNRKCDENVGLGSYEVNFSYVEAGEQKQALVKLVACKRCAEKLAHKRQKEKEKEIKLSGEEEMDLKERDKRKREHDDESEDSTEDESSEKRSRKKKDRKGTSKRKVGNKDDDFEEFLEGMFP